MVANSKVSTPPSLSVWQQSPEIDQLHANTGIVITNLGTPAVLTEKAVRKYLGEFLADPDVVSLPRWIWLPILYGLILPIRSKQSLQLYKKVWTKEGSPLLVGCKKIFQKLQEEFSQSQNIKCALGMRYGDPTLKNALLDLKKNNINKLLLLPLYPQYSTTTTASTQKKVLQIITELQWDIEVQFISHYAEHPAYVAAIATQINAFWHKTPPGQKLLFSFHGIPKRLSAKGDPYENLCFATAKAIAAKLNLADENWQIVFQSRFGREEWLQPYCAKMLQELAQQGYTHIDIVCPGFPIDCLETLEEIAITNKKIFFEAGGQQFNYIPALNDSDAHVVALKKIIADEL